MELTAKAEDQPWPVGHPLWPAGLRIAEQAAGPSDLALEVWQVPSTATPELKESRRVAGRVGHKFAAGGGSAIENCARGMEAMAREEAAYWLGMAMHNKSLRRVLAALRLRLSAN